MIGEDIKEVLEEIGTPFTIVGKDSDEYLLFKENRQATKPFIREFFLQADLSYDTEAITGDVVILTPQSIPYIVMNKTGIELEGVVYKYSTVLYKANVSGEILHPSGEVRDLHTYQKRTAFDLVTSGEYALLTEAPYTGADLEEGAYGQVSVKNKVMYIPQSSGIEVNDRFQPSSGEFYKVITISTRMFGAGIVFCELEEDTR